MAMDPQEQSKLRQERAAQRRKREKRRFFIGLGIAGAVISVALASFFVIRAIIRRNPDPSKVGSTTIHFAAAGDLNVTTSVVQSGGAAYDYTQALRDVAPLLADADIAALNFEGNLVGAPYGSDTASAPQELMKALDRAGVDLVQLANSYSINHGISGLRSTISAVKTAGMTPLGVYSNEAEYQAGKGYTIRTVKGIKIGFAAFTKGMDGMALPSGSEHCVNLLYTDYSSNYQKVNRAGITAVLDAMNKEDPDITIVMLHWGSEFNDTVSSTQKDIVDLLQSKGVDAIIGTHPHYVQQMKLDAQANTFVAYSLGDFFGDASRAGSEYSVILDLEITKDHRTGDTRITGYSYTPIFTVTDEGALRVVRIREAMAAYDNNYFDKISKATYDKMAYALQRIEARVNGD